MEEYKGEKPNPEDWLMKGQSFPLGFGRMGTRHYSDGLDSRYFELLEEYQDKTIKCKFINHKSTERICKNCGYVIGRTNRDYQAIQDNVKYTGEKPKCNIN